MPGKDITCWNLAIRQCLKKVCLVLYVFPTYASAKRNLWDAISSDSVPFREFIPPEVIASVNSSEMKITFVNGSILQVVGGKEHATSIRGSNPYGVIMSEYAYYDSGEILDTISPILAANNGWLVIISTPNGKNHQYALHQLVKDMPNWFVYVKKTSDIQHISQEHLAFERARMSEEKYQQEYECSYSRGVDGAIYGRALQRLEQAGQITHVAWEPGLLVHTVWDIGLNDTNVILFFNTVGDGTIIRLIDCYSNHGLGLDHYVKIINDKPYTYGKHFAPHDLMVREWGNGGITRYEKARQLGITFTVLPQADLQDGIENVLTHFPKFWIDAEKCKSLVNALENYYRQWDETKQLYGSKPVHNWASHWADAVRYLCQAIYKTKKGMTAEEFDRKKNEALYGSRGNLPGVFRNIRGY